MLTGGYFRCARRNKHRFYDLIRGIFTWVDRPIVRTFLLRAMGSNRVIITLEQQVDVLEEFRTIASKWTLLLQRIECSNDSRLDRLLTLWQWHCINQAACANDHHASCLTSSSTSWMLTHVYARTYTHNLHTHTTLILSSCQILLIQCSGYNYVNIIIIIVI